MTFRIVEAVLSSLEVHVGCRSTLCGNFGGDFWDGDRRCLNILLI
jgi:hypothetical protein